MTNPVTPPWAHTPMTPEDLAASVATIMVAAMQRVGPGSIGAEQYHVEGKPQKFEGMPLPDLIEYQIEEALDLVNYSVMVAIRLYRLKEAAEAMIE